MKPVVLISVLAIGATLATAFVLRVPLPRFATNQPDSAAAEINPGLRVAPLSRQVDSIVVLKKHRKMYLFNKKKQLKIYNVALGTTPIGPKHFQNDRKTPEGLYYINGKNPNSIAHKSIGISYPNDNDRQYARKFGKPTGGDIKIHGLLNGEEANRDAWMNHDWTWGCIALNNEDLDELYVHVSDGVPINILP